MRLAFCLFKYFPFGGLQRDFLRIAKACVNRGAVVDVYTMEWVGNPEPSLNVNIISISALQNHTRSQKFVAEVLPHLVNGQYDLVIGFNKMPYLDVYFAADTCYQAKTRQERAWWYRFTPRYRHLISYEKAVFAPESKTEILLLLDKLKTDFLHYYQTPTQRLHVLPPGIARDRMAPPNAAEIRRDTRNEYGIHEDEFLLLMVGSDFNRKGLDRILLGLAALPENLKNRSRLFVLGKDDPDPFIQQAQQLKISERVKFLGGCDDVPRFLLAGDMLLHPAYHENTGTILLEAVVAGLPVLTTEICGFASYIQDAEAGYVLPSPFQQEQLNQQLAIMLSSSSSREERRQNGLKFGKQADIYNQPEYVATLIEKIAKNSSFGNSGNIRLLPELKKYFSMDKNLFAQIMSLRGKIYRELEGRCTQRIALGKENYFIKQHFGVGWKEIIKNLVQLRLPVLSAKNEWLALQRLKELNIAVPDVVGYGLCGSNPSQLQSFLLTRELPQHVSLEDFCRDWNQTPPVFGLKRALIKEVARIARTLHENGINHRDFYICHFLLISSYLPFKNKNIEGFVYLLDLHRAQIRKCTPLRWIIKDLSGLYFSSKDIGLTSRDLLRFIKEYRQQSWRQVIIKEFAFWQKVKKRGNKIYQTHKRQYEYNERNFLERTL